MPAYTKYIVPGVLGFTILIAFIDMIISAVLVSSYNRSSYPSTHIKNVVRYTLFVSIFNIIFGAGFAFASIALSTSIIASIAGLAGITFLLWIFWLASAASTANSLGGPFSCSNENFAHCHQLLAMEAFGWINFIVLFLTFAVILYFGFRASRKGDGFTGALSA